MATTKKLTDNHLTCAICTEVFTDPATLQCNHTFCKSCLLKYTKTQSEAIHAKSIPCPSCRQQTKVTNAGSPVEEWVSQLKPSHVIQSLMDNLVGTPDVDACSVCKEDGQTTPGTMWCSTCEDVFCDGCLKFHKKMPLSRDHEVLDMRIHGNRKPKARSFMCKIHKDEKIKLFCKDCRVAICTVCCSIKHRKCDDVETIDVMVPLVKEALVSETRIQEKKIRTHTDNIASTNSRIEKLTTNAQEMKEEISKVRMAATEVLVRKEKELLDRIDKLTETHVQDLKVYRKRQEIDLQVEQQRHEVTDKALTSDCVADMFAMYESVDGASRGEDAREDKKPRTCSIIFEHDTKRLMRSVDGVKLGEVKVVHDPSRQTLSNVALHVHDTDKLTRSVDKVKLKVLQGPSRQTLCPVAVQTFDIVSDSMLCTLHDVAVMTADCGKVILVSDVTNNILRIVYTSNKTSSQEHVQLPSAPRQIAKVDEAKAAVALPETQQIAFIKFGPEPTLESTVRTRRMYSGLACLNSSQLVAGCSDKPASVDILDMGGKVLKSINTGVKYPHHIHVTRSNNVVVSDVKSLVCITPDGQTVFTYTSKGDGAQLFPRGITSTSTGDILLVVRENLMFTSASKVIQLTESGQFVRDLSTESDGLQYSNGICLDDDSLLYVTSGNNVKVFSL